MATKRRILLVDDELTILLTLKAVLEISGFDVETAASAREAKSKLRANQYQMVITDLRMETESSGLEVVQAAKKAPYQPAVAMLTAFPLPGSEWAEGADKMLVKPMNTHDLLIQLESLLVNHEDRKRRTLVATASNARAAAKSLDAEGGGNYISGKERSKAEPLIKKKLSRPKEASA